MEKTIILLLLCSFVYPSLAKDQTTSKAQDVDKYTIVQRNLKKFGLAYCISKFHRGNQVPQDIELAQSTYFEGANINNKAFNNLMDYIEKTIPKNILYTPLDDQPMYFLSCMNMYESTEYIKTVNNLVKKYLYQ